MVFRWSNRARGAPYNGAMMQRTMARKRMLALALPMAAMLSPGCGEAPAPHPDAEALLAEPPPAEPRTEAAVVAAFDGYRLAAADGRGADALEYVHEPYYDLVRHHLDLVLDAGRDDVEALSFADRYMVLSLRMRVAPERLRTITPRALAELAIEEGWLSQLALTHAEVDRVVLLPEGHESPWRAEIFVSALGQQGRTPMPMFYEGGGWKIDLKTLFERAAPQQERMAEMLGPDADAIILRGIAAKDGIDVPEDVYAPIGRE